MILVYVLLHILLQKSQCKTHQEVNKNITEFVFNEETNFDFELHSYDNSIDVLIGIHYSDSNICSGSAWNLEDHFMVFNCSTDYNCMNCKSFTILGLYANTMYRVKMKMGEVNLDITKNIKTKYHLSSSVKSNYTSIQVCVSRSINLTAICFGNVYEKQSGITVFNCENDDYCQFCVNYSIFNLKENTEYIYNISSVPIANFQRNIFTEKFWNVKLESTFNKITVDIKKFSSIVITCSGFLFDDQNNEVFNCDSNENCKSCNSFFITELIQNHTYHLDLKTNFSTAEVHRIIKTDFLFDVEPNISYFNFSVQSTKLYNVTTNCSGYLVNLKNQQHVFSCEKDESCRKCESFNIDGLVQNDIYLISILADNSYVFLNRTFQPKPIWNVSITIYSTKILVSIVHNFVTKYVCRGTVVDVYHKDYFYNCSNDINCMICEEFTLRSLRAQSAYNISLSSNVQNVKIKKIIRTKNIIDWNYTATFNFIYIRITSSQLSMKCSGNIIELDTHSIIFQCYKAVSCIICKSFILLNLQPNKVFFVDIRGSVAGATIFGYVKTDKYELKILKIVSYPTFVYLDMKPNYKYGGLCHLELYDKFETKIDIKCLKKCPIDCDDLDFTIISLKLNSAYTLVIKNKYLEKDLNISFFTNSIIYKLKLTSMNETSFQIYPAGNIVDEGNYGTCNINILHVQTGSVQNFVNNCTEVSVNEIKNGNSYRVFLTASLSETLIDPLTVYTIPLKPENIRFHQLNDTALLVEATLDISQPAPVILRSNLFYNTVSVVHEDYYTNSQFSDKFTHKYVDVKAVIKIVPGILINVGVCSYISTLFCMEKWIEFCSNCVYKRVPIYNISFTYPGDVILVSVGQSIKNLMIILPVFESSNRWVATCSIYIGKILYSNLSNFSPQNISYITDSIYKGNYWKLLYQADGYWQCKYASNITFGDKNDKKQKNLNFISQNLYYVGILQLCGPTKCLTSRLSNVEFLDHKKAFLEQLVLFCIAFFISSITFVCIIIILIVKKIKPKDSNRYEVQKTQESQLH